MSLSCVTRETSQDDCSYSRFLAWTAVRRNSCRLMSSTEKLSCPLHQCRKLFQDHESMLKHIAACQYLPTREYWCYDHMRVERFDDAKCKRCISHPSRRRKMLSMAKSFFSTLGHKPRRLPECNIDIDDTMSSAPPSYHEALDLSPPAKPELPSTEILEIDSTEVPIPQVLVTKAPTPSIDPQALLLPELDSTTIPIHSGMQWQPTPYYHPPTNNQPAPAYESLCAARPASQGPSHGTQPNRQAPRSKNLSPSSSIRSTTSTMSNISNVSSITTTSSIWSTPSTAWSGLETNLTEESFADINKQCLSDSLYPLPEIPELPADMPVMPELSSGDYAGFQDTLFSFDTNLASTNISYPENFGLEEETVEPPIAQPKSAESLATPQPDVKSLVAFAWEALQEHIISSLSKIHNVHNPLADQLRLLSAETIATRGLGCLRGILSGSPPTSALDTICLVHVVYSFSIVVYVDDAVSGGDAARRSCEFFAQSMHYATWFAPETQAYFRQVVRAIWQPRDMANEQVSRLLKEQPVPLQRSPSDKGKEPATRPNASYGDKTDPLISTAQNFLDELEISAILGSSTDTQAYGLQAKHCQDTVLTGRVDLSTVHGPGLMNVLNVLVERFRDVNGLVAELGQVNKRLSSGLLGSTRRFELEALQAGHSCIVPVKYFDDYVPLVRSLCNPIYELDGPPGASRRQDYQSLGIALSEQLITELAGELGTVELDAGAISEDDLEHDDLFASLTPPLTDNFLDVDMDMDMEIQPLLDLGPDESLLHQSALETTERDASTAPSKAGLQSPSDSGASTNHAAPTPSSSGSPPQHKVEADACCELCGYRPKGDPRWFHGSMAKHRKLQHSTDPPKIYRCGYPGCNSAYKNRPDNLRQHQLEKNHFVEGQDGATRRSSKKRKTAS
ncbi:hypothetical protein VPNG_03184 [Cytospora leucostoma]|uniref:Uncharacterized protein n=1 Tax=Cytospora leucostoma TaxID=1230097 RepID=A0A423XES1_9PEZI|nr:hypothetical protein VPNG_03184 [Cytospora leucostoma]